MESILNPRAYIDPKFETITLITRDGKEITGRKRHLIREDLIGRLEDWGLPFPILPAFHYQEMTC
jgi:hypothetical protein